MCILPCHGCQCRCVFEHVCVFVQVQTYICFTFCNVCEQAYVLSEVHKGRSVLPAGGVKALCVLALNAPLLVWRFLLISPGSFSDARAHTHSRLHKQTLVLKDWEKYKRGQKFSNFWHICKDQMFTYTLQVHIDFHQLRSRSYMYTSS